MTRPKQNSGGAQDMAQYGFHGCSISASGTATALIGADFCFFDELRPPRAISFDHVLERLA